MLTWWKFISEAVTAWQ